jgi:CubicO group peptidase (beta-lactamase class C family)
MFVTVGLLIEAVTGLTWEEFVKTRIFTPLKIKSGCYRVKQGEPFATLYEEDKKGVVKPCAPLKLDAMGPAGSINATARDMAEWLKFNLAKGKAGRHQLVDEKVFPELYKPNIAYELLPFDVPENKTMGYGLGWFIDCYRGEKLVEHGGNVNGASSLVSFLPEKNSGCVILTNADHSLLTYALAYYIHDLLLGYGGQKDWAAFIGEEAAKMKSAQEEQIAALRGTKLRGKRFTHAAEEYFGSYSNPGYGELSVTGGAKAGGFSLTFHDNTLALEHMHYDIFMGELYGIPIPVSFKTGIKGEIESVAMGFEPGGEPTVFSKVAKAEKEEPNV